MRTLLLSLAAIPSLVLQISSASLLPRSQVCANDGATIAGTLYHRRDVLLPTLNPRTSGTVNLRPSMIIWCGVGTSTYLVINFLTRFGEGSPNSPLLLSMLRDAIIGVQDHIRQHGDGPIEGGVFRFADYGFNWISSNAANHQQTWGVVGSAIEVLTQYMRTYDTYGAASFRIYDGRNQVGQGTLQHLG